MSTNMIYKDQQLSNPTHHKLSLFSLDPPYIALGSIDIHMKASRQIILPKIVVKQQNFKQPKFMTNVLTNIL